MYRISSYGLQDVLDFFIIVLVVVNLHVFLVGTKFQVSFRSIQISVACRHVARQRQQNTQLYNSLC
jgi:hypothetical protein